MDNLVLLLCKSVGVSALLYANYWLLLRNRNFHLFNRVYLLGTIAASLIFPFIPVTTVVLQPAELHVHGNTSIAAMLYASVAVLLLVSFIISISKICRVKRRGLNMRIGNITVIETQLEQAPFSFFTNLFWRKDISIQSAEGKKVWMHELAHITQKHSYDKLFVHFIACIGWINPFCWMIKREIGMVHEFLADEKSVDPGDTASFARMLLLSSHKPGYFHPGQSFFQSPVSRRLMMIRRAENIRFAHLRKWSVFPVAAVVLFLCSFTIQNKYDFLQRQHAEKLAAEKAALK